MVGRTPWSAADALVGLLPWRKRSILRAKSGTRASRADRGFRPTNSAAFHLLGLTKWHWAVVSAPPYWMATVTGALAAPAAVTTTGTLGPGVTPGGTSTFT